MTFQIFDSNPVILISGQIQDETEFWGLRNFTVDTGFCSENCLVCTDISTCEQCNTTYKLYKNKCVLSCPIHSSDCKDYEDLIPYSRYLAKGYYDLNMTYQEIIKFLILLQSLIVYHHNKNFLFQIIKQYQVVYWFGKDPFLNLVEDKIQSVVQFDKFNANNLYVEFKCGVSTPNITKEFYAISEYFICFNRKCYQCKSGYEVYNNDCRSICQGKELSLYQQCQTELKTVQIVNILALTIVQIVNLEYALNVMKRKEGTFNLMDMQFYLWRWNSYKCN